MPIFPLQGGSRNTWGTELRNFFSPYFNLTTGLFVTASVPGWAIDAGIAWTQVVKTGSSIADLTNHDHSTLTSTGTYNHPAIDTFIGTMNTFVATKGQASGLASLDANSLVVQQPAVHTHTSTTTGGIVDHVNLTSIGTNTHAAIDTFIASKAAASGLASLNASSLVVQNPVNATTTSTASKIPIADGSGKLDGWITVTNKAFLMFANNSGFSPGFTSYLSIMGALAPANEGLANQLAPAAGTISKLYIKANGNTLDSATTVTLRKNGASTSLTATITAGSTSVFSDLSNTVSVAAGDVLAWQLTIAAGTGTLTGLAISALLT